MNNSEKKYLANMDYGYGNTETWLKCTKDDKNIYFTRNVNHVHAWHCNSLPINDRRILKIKSDKTNNNEKRR